MAEIILRSDYNESGVSEEFFDDEAELKTGSIGNPDVGRADMKDNSANKSITEESMEENTNIIKDTVENEGASVPEDNAFEQMEEPVAAEANIADDDLLAQIEEFKQKAILIRQMTESRQSELADLEQSVTSKTEENERLQASLDEKIQTADELKKDVETQVDRMMGDVKTTFDTFDGKITEGFGSVSDDISDKIHKENVRVYRNIQTLVEEKDKQEEIMQLVKAETKGVRAGVVWAIVLSLINTAGIAALLLISFGII